mgnify:FL=1
MIPEEDIWHLQDQANWAKENLEIEEYEETVTKTYSRKRFKGE